MYVTDDNHNMYNIVKDFIKHNNSSLPQLKGPKTPYYQRLCLYK